MWQPDEETLYFLDLGMIGEVGPDLREHMMLLLMAFWQQDVGFLTDVTLMLTGAINRTDLDVEAFQEELGALMARNRGVSLKEIQLGPVLQEMTEIALRHDVAAPGLAHADRRRRSRRCSSRRRRWIPTSIRSTSPASS